MVGLKLGIATDLEHIDTLARLALFILVPSSTFAGDANDCVWRCVFDVSFDGSHFRRVHKVCQGGRAPI